MPIVARKPSAISGISIRMFNLGHDIASGLARIQSRNLRFSHPRNVHRRFVPSLPGGNALIHLGGGVSGATGRDPVPQERCALELLPSKQRVPTVSAALGVGLSLRLGLAA
jgi:hypothetical protein